jgi:EAL domain-containing protein (putative c-di-GMP-specific phosphodiesterase class I)
LELIQTAIDKKFLTIHYQPIFDLQTNLLSGLEALLRLEDKNGRILPPSVFLHIAKEHSKMPEVTMQLIRQVYTDLNSLPPNITVSINIPPDILVTPHHEQKFLTLLAELQLPKDQIIFEITEEDNTNINELASTVTKLVSQGYKFALDDFGAGSSSLSRLAIVPVTTVKLDISLLRAASRGRIAPLESATALAKRLDAKVTIEGVESAEQLVIAQNVEADLVQGFYLSEPLSLDKINTLPSLPNYHLT